MIQVTAGELTRLQQSLASLEEVLDTLDELGAGIAAIHVDAAVNQLKNNLDVIADESTPVDTKSFDCPSEHRVTFR